ncbi:anti-sigma factor domain-containing protein [Dokdonia sp. Hel_I_53]|uniref:anti-sigma factor domain-containing protein n=1 Tax=Dokdonia sp. Hel_I_53 TaxID=1566287 RepID=UPI0011993BCD|nr:anti-sigma factor [Dokdonia sp. Hel_I_53]TVZ52082.1 anti-sigma-K factor rskA [Dokdonia sp. Hel_I_53]
MSDRVSQFLESDLLERYLMGTTSPIESQEAEYFIEKFPEVKSTYEELQENLENYAASYAVKVPKELRATILKQTKSKPQRALPILAITACMVAILFSLVAFMIYEQNQELLRDRQFTSNLLESLNDDIVSNRQMLQSVEEQFMILNSAATQKYILTGNKKARKLEAVAYVNQLEKRSYIHVASLPELPDEQVYQMWAEVDGKLVPLDILKLTKDNLVEIPYEERMASINVTIEPKGGSKVANTANEVATIIFNRENQIPDPQ